MALALRLHESTLFASERGSLLQAGMRWIALSIEYYRVAIAAMRASMEARGCLPEGRPKGTGAALIDFAESVEPAQVAAALLLTKEVTRTAVTEGAGAGSRAERFGLIQLMSGALAEVRAASAAHDPTLPARTVEKLSFLCHLRRHQALLLEDAREMLRRKEAELRLSNQLPTPCRHCDQLGTSA